MQNIVLQFSLYTLYDRIFYGVYADISVDFNPDSIVNDNINNDNFKLQSISFSNSSLKFIQKYKFDSANLIKEVSLYLSQDDYSNLKELFFESLIEFPQFSDFEETYFNKFHPD